MFALPAATASWLSVGIAKELICALRESPYGYWTAAAAVIFPPLTVIRT